MNTPRVPMQSVLAYQERYGIASQMDALKSLAPSVFTTDSSPKVSAKYQHVNTIDIINHMLLKGWNLDQVGETRVTQKTRERGLAPYVQHAVTLRHPEFKLGKLKKDDVTPNIMLGGSHNTSSVVWMMGGIYRCWCDNQALVSIGDLFYSKHRHIGSFQVLMDGIYRSLDNMVAQVDKIGEPIQKWQSLTLTVEQRYEYFRRVIELRPESKAKTLAKENFESFDYRRRGADLSNDLFTVYQVVQEHTMRGLRVPILVNGQSAERSLTRPVSGVNTFVDLNRALWSVTDRFADELVNG